MTRTEGSITGFRRRLLQLIDQQCDGRYSRLARRAGLAVSSVQYHIHHARNLPGGEHLARMAAVLGVTLDYLVNGDETVRPADGPPRFIPVIPRGDGSHIRTHLTIPVLMCACPNACPLMDEAPLAAARTMMIERDLVHSHAQQRLIAVEVTPGCPSPEWPVGTRLVVAWGIRPAQRGALGLIHTEGHCEWGHLTQVADALFCASEAEGDFRVIPAREWKILGAAVAAIVPL
jgi:transcriptional regulator with XRE-family HTH domain